MKTKIFRIPSINLPKKVKMLKMIFKMNMKIINKSKTNFIGSNNIFAIIFMITPPNILALIIDTNMSIVNIK